MSAQKQAVITGSSSGIGAAITATLLAAGWKVIGLSRQPGAHQHPNFRHCPLDITDTPALCALLDSLPAVDAVIHAAGVMKAATLGTLSYTDSEQLWKLHIQVAEVLADRLVNKLPQGGRIILLGSRTSSGAAGRSQYVATKSAMIGMVRSWAAELAPRGITVNIVAPGATEHRCSTSREDKVHRQNYRPLAGLFNRRKWPIWWRTCCPLPPPPSPDNNWLYAAVPRYNAVTPVSANLATPRYAVWPGLRQIHSSIQAFNGWRRSMPVAAFC